MNQPSKDTALALLHEWTLTDSLRKHAYAVEAACRWYARHYNEDEELWGITGLLHDFDYERHPDPTPETGHPFAGCKYLLENGYPQEMVTAILGHANYSGVPRESLLAKVLFGVDELSGLVMATTYVRPDRSLHTLESSSVKKKMKDKTFAKGVSRDDINNGVAALNLPLEEHISNVINALREVAPELGLAGA
jgi:predicted hydrolase (HD superfamily)